MGEISQREARWSGTRYRKKEGRSETVRRIEEKVTDAQRLLQ